MALVVGLPPVRIVGQTLTGKLAGAFDALMSTNENPFCFGLDCGQMLRKLLTGHRILICNPEALLGRLMLLNCGVRFLP